MTVVSNLGGRSGKLVNLALQSCFREKKPLLSGFNSVTSHDLYYNCSHSKYLSTFVCNQSIVISNKPMSSSLTSLA